MEIDWTDPACKVSKYFTVYEAIYLPAWVSLATDLTDDIKEALVNLFEKMDAIREHLNVPLIVHVSFRPEKYNKLVGGAKHSAHMARKENGHLIAACDFHPSYKTMGRSESCTYAKELLQAKVASLGMRMEDNGKDAGWIHLDTAPVPPGGHIFFKP